MKYDVTYSCGHTGTVELYGAGKDRERRLQYLAKTICCDCQNQQAKDRAANAGLPTLQGSEKQVNWAASIRMAFADKAQAIIETTKTNAERAIQAQPADADKIIAARDNDLRITTAMTDSILSGRTSAAWWIDNRGKDALELMRIEYANKGGK